MEDRLQIYLYDGIDSWGDSSAQSVVAQLAAYTQAGGVDVYINSLGGSVFEGLGIYNALVRSDLDVATHVDGAALSIASVIAQAGTERRIARGGLMMVHNPTIYPDQSDPEQLEAMAANLAEIRSTIAGVYASRAGGTQAAWVETMKTEKYYGPDAALTAGLVDTIVDLPVQTEEPQNGLPSRVLNLDVLRVAMAARAADHAPQMSARVVAPARRAQLSVTDRIVNLFNPAAKATTPPTMKLKDLLGKLNLTDDTEIEINDEATPAAETPAATETENKAAATPATEAAPTGDSAIDKLAATVTNLSQMVESLTNERKADAQSDYEALLDRKIQNYALDESDRPKWLERAKRLGVQNAAELLREKPDGARKPRGVRAPQNRGTQTATNDGATAPQSFADYFADRQDG